MRNAKFVLGISAYYHDSAAALLCNNEIIGACQEERLSRIKGDNSFPIESIIFCLEKAGITINDIDALVYYEKPLRKFHRVIASEVKFNRESSRLFKNGEEFGIVRSWIESGMLDFDNLIQANLEKVASRQKVKYKRSIPVLFSNHHLSHAAAAFLPSKFETAAILTIDGVGERDTTCIFQGSRNNNGVPRIEKLESVEYPNSVGLLYATFTSFLGFKVNSGEYKVMGLAPYGKPIFAETIRNNFLDVDSNGLFKLKMDYLQFHKSNKMYDYQISELLGIDERSPESELKQEHFDVAASIQEVTNQLVVGLAKRAKELTQEKRIVMGGGVALNCVSNSRILAEQIFKEIWIQPAAGDAGSALGAALAFKSLCSDYGSEPLPKREHLAINSRSGKTRVNGEFFSPYLGPEYTDSEIRSHLIHAGLKYHREKDELCEMISARISEGKIVGWFQGRMEFGPRALGNRSILADPRGAHKRDEINLKIKFRESFRPFAPAVLEDHAEKWFNLKATNSEEILKLVSPYMLLIAQAVSAEVAKDIPSCVHVDGSARIQTVSREQNQLFYNLIDNFYKLTGIPILVNTSFNIRGEPIVATPQDAIRCFLGTELDILVMGDFVVEKKNNANKSILSYSTLSPKD